ncbi:MAG: tetratricopeptide repeat protein, partial [Verrucomicrobia bacterium]|nr:tetratricopeptide repeat protein [Verrucomicrobiota bacterium]
LRLLLEKWPFFLLTAAFCVVTLWSQNGTGAVQSESNFPFAARIEDAVISYAEYLWQTVWPLNLAVFYPANGTEFQLLPKAVAMAVGLAVVSWAVWQARRAHPYLLVGWLWFLGTLVPVIGLVKVGAAVRADRYTYIPLIGIFVATAFGARAFIRRVRLKAPWPAVVACGVLGACCVLTERQLGYWQDSVTLFSHALAVTRENDIAHSNLGVALDKRGLRKEALVQYQAAARVAPTSSNAHNNLGNWYYESGDTKRAMAEYREALRLSPGSADARINLGNADASLGRYNEALTNYIDARRLNPRDPTTPYLVGRTLLQEGRSMDAMPFFRQSLRMDPNNPRVLAFLAQVLASDEDPKVRDGYAAYLMAQKASHLAGGSNPVMLDALGMAYAELGRFADAQSAARDALRLARRFDTNDVAILSSHLKLYENHQAVRQSFAGKPASQPGGIIRPGAD